MNIPLVSCLQPDAPSGVRVHYLQLANLLRRHGHCLDLTTTGLPRGWRQKLVATHFDENHMTAATLAFYQEAIQHFRAVEPVAAARAALPRRFALVEETPSSAL